MIQPSRLEKLAKRTGAALERGEAPAPPPVPAPAPRPDPVLAAVTELGRVVRDLPSMMPPPSVVEVPVPAAINAEELGRAIASALGKTASKPVSWRFKVKRNVDGLIDSIEAQPLP